MSADGLAKVTQLPLVGLISATEGCPTPLVSRLQKQGTKKPNASVRLSLAKMRGDKN